MAKRPLEPIPEAYLVFPPALFSTVAYVEPSCGHPLQGKPRTFHSLDSTLSPTLRFGSAQVFDVHREFAPVQEEFQDLPFVVILLSSFGPDSRIPSRCTFPARDGAASADDSNECQFFSLLRYLRFCRILSSHRCVASFSPTLSLPSVLCFSPASRPASPGG